MKIPTMFKTTNFSRFKIRFYGLFFFAGFVSMCAFSQTKDQHRNGKLLQGDQWLPFSYPEKADFYVSLQGDDRWSGTLSEPNSSKTDGPFLTIERAQKAVLDLKSKVYFPKDIPVEKRWIGSPHPLGRGKDILVYIRQGNYFIKQTLVFEPSDGGERVETNLPTGAFEYHKLKDHYVTYAAYPGEKPVISGGIPVSDWKKNGKIWSTRLDADTAAMFIVNGKRQVLARTPNDGYFVPPAISKNPSELYFRKGEIKPWTEMENNRVIMLLRWHTGVNTIINVDEKNGVATFKSPQEGVVIVPPRYYIENVKALLDAPGEWFFDKKLKELTYYPASGITDPNQIKAAIPNLNQLVRVSGKMGQPVRNLRFYGLTFEGATAGSSAIIYEFAHACEFFGGEVRSCNGTGISISKGCYQTLISNNRFETLDNGGIYANGLAKPADGREIIRESNLSYNQFYDCGRVSVGCDLASPRSVSGVLHVICDWRKKARALPTICRYTPGRYWRNSPLPAGVARPTPEGDILACRRPLCRWALLQSHHCPYEHSAAPGRARGCLSQPVVPLCHRLHSNPASSGAARKVRGDGFAHQANRSRGAVSPETHHARGDRLVRHGQSDRHHARHARGHEPL